MAILMGILFLASNIAWALWTRHTMAIVYHEHVHDIHQAMNKGFEDGFKRGQAQPARAKNGRFEKVKA